MAHAHPTEFSRDANRRVVLALGLTVIAIGLTVAAFIGDDACMQWMQAHQNRMVSSIASKFSKYGDWPELMVYGWVILGIAWIRRASRLAHLIVCMMLASTLAGATVNAIRLLSGRTRPSEREIRDGWYGLWYGNTFLLRKNKFHSFPSGHTASAFAFFGTAACAHRRWGWLFLSPAGAIAWSRLYLNAHHLSDVVVALILGLLLCFVVWRRAGPPLRRWFDARCRTPESLTEKT
jgi:membrane-associated phospholipid phosphatase